MPRDGANVYTQPFPDVSAGTTIASAVYNGFTHDVAQDLNTPRPIVAGGTGASDANTSLFNLGAEKAAQVVTNYDSQLWVPGSFYSATTATGEPVDGHAFSGVAYIGEALANPPTNQNVTLEARDATDGKLYIRRKTAGTWGSWTLDGDLSGVTAGLALKVDKAGDTMTGPLVLPAAAPTLGTHATNKTYVDGLDTAQKTYIDNANTTQDTAITAATTAANNRVRYDGAQGLTTGQMAQARQNISAPLRGWIAGLTLSTAGSSATFGIAAGEAADSTSVFLMQLASAYTKTTAAWAVGSGNGALDTGSIGAAAWYHVYLIRRPDTGVVDVLVSLSATAPTLPGGGAYTQFRRIGSMKTAASQWVAFSQEGDEFIWAVRAVDFSAASTSGDSLFVVTVPTGIKVWVMNSAVQVGTAGAVGTVFSSPDETTGPGGGNGPLFTVGTGIAGGSGIIRTNTSAQIRRRSADTSATITHSTVGWIDRRGRDG